MNATQQEREALAPCPFCGNPEPSFERTGTPRQSCIVVCGNCGCRHESSDEGVRSGTQWNCRASLPPTDAMCKAHGDALQRIGTALGLLPGANLHEDCVRAIVRLREALEGARTGLLWYQDAHPEHYSPADDEMMAQIDAALSAKEPK